MLAQSRNTPDVQLTHIRTISVLWKLQQAIIRAQNTMCEISVSFSLNYPLHCTTLLYATTRTPHYSGYSTLYYTIKYERMLSIA